MSLPISCQSLKTSSVILKRATPSWLLTPNWKSSFLLNDINRNRVCRQNDAFVICSKTNSNEISFTYHDIFAVVVGS